MSARTDKLIEQIPAGAGLGLRRELWHQTLDAQASIDFVEIVIDDYLDYPIKEVQKSLAPVMERFEVIAHGVCLSVGTAGSVGNAGSVGTAGSAGTTSGVDPAYVDRVARLLDALEIEVYTEHLSFRRGGAHEVAQFVPTPFTQAWAQRVARNVRYVQDVTKRTLALENVTYLLGHPHAGIGEAMFVRQVLEEADCGLLLDVTNLLINAANLNYSAETYLETLPDERIVLAHVAGGHTDGPYYIDSHSSSPPDEALAVLGHVAQKGWLRSATLERDKAYPDTIDPLLDELADIRAELSATRPHPSPTCHQLAPLGQSRSPGQPSPAQPSPHQPPDIDQVDPQLFQATLASLLVRPGAYREVRRGGELSVDRHSGDRHSGDQFSDDQQQVLRSYLLSFPPERVRAFGKILRYKRRENIEAVLPGTCRLLGEALPDCLRSYFESCPKQGLTRLEDACRFARHLDELDEVGVEVRSMATHERMVRQLQERPYRFWEVFKRRASTELYFEPRLLDATIHRQAKLPEPLPEPITVRYTRRRKGVWIDVLAGPERTEEIR